MARPDQPLQLSAAARYMLVELDELAAPWELAGMTYKLLVLGSEGSVVGPGLTTESAEERLRMAQDAAAELLRAGLIVVRQGPDRFEEGRAVGAEEAAALVSDPVTWRPPNDPERTIYAWFDLTPHGFELAHTVSLEDIPSAPLPRAGAPDGVTSRHRLLASLKRLRTRSRRKR